MHAKPATAWPEFSNSGCIKLSHTHTISHYLCSYFVCVCVCCVESKHVSEGFKTRPKFVLCLMNEYFPNGFLVKKYENVNVNVNVNVISKRCHKILKKMRNKYAKLLGDLSLTWLSLGLICLPLIASLLCSLSNRFRLHLQSARLIEL